MLTYKQAYDLLIDAYYKDKIKPYDPEFCFCGTLNNNDSDWYDWRCSAYASNVHEDGLNYNGRELWRMEDALLITLHIELNTENKYSQFRNHFDVTEDLYYEEVLFEGFCKALDVLKQIHIERGEVIDEVCELSKRVLVK